MVRSQQPTVLVVEDNQIMRTMLRVTLEAEGYAVLEAASGAEAVARMAAGPDLVLQDLALPDVDGLELVKQLRMLPAGAAIPILAVSGFLSKLEGLRPDGEFTDVVTKPVEPSRLAEIVRSYLPVPGATAARPGGGRTCLVVDDDYVQLRLLATHLEQAGFRVRTAADGAEALAAARGARPEIVVSDVLMPGMDGFELCVALRSDPALADVPLVLTSVAYTEQEDAELARLFGADALVTRLPDGQAVVAAALAALERPRTRAVSSPPALPTAQYTHRVVRQLERQAVRNQRLTRRLGWLDAELNVLAGISESLAGDVATETILDELLYRCLDASGASAGAAYLRAADGQQRVRATFGAERQTAALVGALGSPRLASRLVDSPVPLLVPSHELQGRQVERLLESVEAASLIAAPIVLGHEQVGTLIMASTAPGFAEDWLAFARVVGRQIGQAIGLVRALDQVRGEQERLGRIVETVPDGVMIVGLDGDIRFVNAAAARIFGRSAQEMVGHGGNDANWHLTDLDGRAIAESERVTARVASTGAPMYGVERAIRRPDGSQVILSMNAAPLHGPDGTIAGTVLALTDVTERKRAEAERERLLASERAALAELRATQQQIVQQERLRALGQMASGVAHDFNNALAPIVAYADLLLMQPEKLADTERVKRFLEMIQTAADDATGVVRRLRELYRQRDDDEIVEPVQLDDLIAQVIALTQFRWKDEAQARGAPITIATDLSPTPPVAGNPAELREALTNLVFNALDAMPEGGTLTFSTRPAGQEVALAVGDTGVGMTEDVRLRCLEPFFTTKGEHGTGLGLGLVHGILQRHRGALEIDSTPGAGTTVAMRLPIWTDDGSEAPAPAPAMASAPRPLRVLVVEDEPLIRTAFVEYLRVDGHTVETAPDGRAGLEMFGAGRFDLVLTDRALPGMSGDEVAAAIKRLAPGLPIIMITGFGDLMNRHGVKPDGVDLVVSKPLTLNLLRQSIATVFRS